MPNFQLSCESTVDMPFSYVDGRGISVLFYSYEVDGKEYADDMLRDEEALPRFYRFLEEGKMPSTSQINMYRYMDYLEALVQKGDVLHLSFGSGMTPSVRNAETAAELLRVKYPERKIVVVDSLCSSTGYGMLLDYAADLRDEGKSVEEVEAWLLANRKRIHHQFYSTDMTMYRRSGRVSGATAAIATVLSICPIMRLDDTGHIIAYSKVRGRKAAVAETVRTMAEHAEGGTDYAGKCFICHSHCPQDAEQTRLAVLAAFPNLREICIFDIGTIIASHTGPGTVSLFFLGDERTPDTSK